MILSEIEIKQVFNKWKDICLGNNENDETTVVSSETLSKLPSVPSVQIEAKQFFQEYTIPTTITTTKSTLNDDNVVSSHETSLALLIQSLHPCFDDTTTSNNTSSLNTKYLALSCLVGAIQGCIRPINTTTTSNDTTTSSNNDTSESTIYYPTLSLSFIQLLYNFLLPFVGPIDFHSSNIDDMMNVESNPTTIEYDTEQIRDLATNGLMALIQCSSSSNSILSSSSSSIDEINMNETTINNSIQLQCTIAMKGVESRCTIESLSNNNNNDNETNYNDDDIIYGNIQQQQHQNLPTIESGLALLPRIRRTLCFTLLQITVDSIVPTIPSNPSKNNVNIIIHTTTKQILLDYMKFTTRCLHGESDPRCILQLLQLFYSILIKFYPLLNNNNTNNNNNHNHNNTTIILDFFDAITPYYPIQFNPPPNDIHGITRFALRQAIIQILSCTLYDNNNNNNNDSDDTMSSLTCGLILDCLLPTPNEEPLSYKEQIEVLEDLQHFLFTTITQNYDYNYNNNNNNNNNQHHKNVTNFEKLYTIQQKQIADALLIVHEIASSAVAAASKTESLKQIDSNNHSSTSVHAKPLADLCRSLLAKIALTAERRSTTKNNLWQTFVEEPVQTVSSKLFQSTSNDSISIAYIACLAACGGLKTLNLCLNVGLTPLLNYVKKNTNTNNTNQYTETLTTVIYGIGAFFASTRAALEVAASEHVNWYPHPLQPCSDVALELILHFLDTSNNTESVIHERGAAIRTMESIILVSPATLFSTERIQELVTCCQKLSIHAETDTENKVLSHEGLTHNSVIENAYSQAFGTLLGQTLEAQSKSTVATEDDNSVVPNLLQAEPLRIFFLDTLLPSLLQSIQKESNQQQDLLLLARAAAYSVHSASYIVQTQTTRLHEALVEGDMEKAKSAAAALGFLFKQEDKYAAQAYHELSRPNVTPFDVLGALAPNSSKNSNNMEALFGISVLQLPTSNDDRQKYSIILDKAYEIVPLLRRAYECEIPTYHFQHLVEWIDKVLPPLSHADATTFSIVVPLLSAAMEQSQSTCIVTSERNANEILYGMVGDLTDFVMATEYHPTARFHAALCLHAAIARFIPRTVVSCPVQDLMENKFMPILQLTERPNETKPDITSFLETLRIVAMLGSAAAQRGGSSSKSADKIIFFLVDLACKKKSDVFSLDQLSNVIDLQQFDTSSERNESTRISMHAASLIGSVLNASGRSCGGIWKQRLTQISFKRILGNYSNVQNGDFLDGLGALSALCHIICTANVQSVLSTNHRDIVGSIVVNGLSSEMLQGADTSTIKLTLVTILKLICTAPSCFKSIYPLVTGTLRAFSVVDESQDGLQCKLLALQSLSAISLLSETDYTALQTIKTLRPAVLSLLGKATDHPLAVIRSAAVEVRNTWSVVVNES